MARAKNEKKILYVASSFAHIQRFHLDCIAALRSDGYTVEIMAKGTNADYDISFEKRLFSFKNALLVPKIKGIIRRGCYGAIILNTSLASFYTRAACPRRKRPRIVNIVHGYLFSEGDRSLRGALLLLAERILRKKTDVIITMNREDTKLAEKFRLTRGMILKIPGMGVKLREQITSPEAVRSEFFRKDAFVMVFVGELSKRKNQKLLIEALKIIKKDIPTAQLCLVGDGALREELQLLADELGLSDGVVFAGERPDACDFIRASDVYVSASTSEGLPFNIVEALGAGKTVIASRVKGHTDIIEDGTDGILYEKGNAADLADRVIKIYRRGTPLSAESIRNKYLMYEKNTVFPKMFSTLKTALKADFNHCL